MGNICNCIEYIEKYDIVKGNVSLKKKKKKVNFEEKKSQLYYNNNFVRLKRTPYII